MERDEAGRRIFTEDHLVFLKIILYLKNTQMPISQIRQYVDWMAEGDSTIALRLAMFQLSESSVEVIEIAPPAVNTDLGGSGLHVHGEPLDAFTDGIFQGLTEGLLEIGYGTSVDRLRMSREQIDKYAVQMYEATRSYIE